MSESEDTMGFFADIDDELTRDLADDYAMLFLAIRKLTDLLNVDSYDEMGGGHEHSARLFESERALSDELRHELREEIPENADPGILASFLKAYRLEAIYPDTVGPMEETASTIPLLTLPKFQARRIDAAKRELKEETGLTAGCWSEIMTLHTSNSITDEVGIVFIAEDLTEGDADPEEMEDLKVRKLSLDDAVQLVNDGEITDAISVAAILRVASLRKASLR